MIGLLLALGCAEPPIAEDPVPDPVVPDAYDVDAEVPDPGAPLTPDQLAEGLDRVVAQVLRTDPSLMHDTWAGLMFEHADPDCPTVVEHNGQDHWREDGCVTDDGTTFQGWSLYFRLFQPQMTTEPLHYLSVGWLSGQATITTAAGVELINYGDVLHERYLDPDDQETDAGFVFGDFWFSGLDGQGTWLQDGVTMEMYFTLVDHHAQARSTALDLQMAYLPDPVPAAIFEDFLLTDEAGACGLEPDGRVWARDDAGRWYEVIFEGAAATGDACDGCGEAWLNDQSVGEVCVDWTPLLFTWSREPR
ncbi:MAG: hypothetical protein H6739_21000 [Alphaproteobacteria bacterium]|nr:hypothetical protein [Alphaproteobacteria bacterium]